MTKQNSVKQYILGETVYSALLEILISVIIEEVSKKKSDL